MTRSTYKVVGLLCIAHIHKLQRAKYLWPMNMLLRKLYLVLFKCICYMR